MKVKLTLQKVILFVELKVVLCALPVMSWLNQRVPNLTHPKIGQEVMR